MAKRKCAIDGKDKDLHGGKVCERGHFICKACVGKNSDWLFSRRLTKCPLCGTRLQ